MPEASAVNSSDQPERRDGSPPDDDGAAMPGYRLAPNFSSLAQGLRTSRLPFPVRSLAVPGAPGANPFNDLPFPNPGDRIRADDFITLSQSLLLIRDAFALSGALFGQSFDRVKLVLSTQRYAISRVMTVFGTEIDDLDDESLDNRKVIQVLPVNLGGRELTVVLSEAVETRRFAPNLIGLTYEEAADRLRNIMGDITFPSRPMQAGDLTGMTLAQAQDELVSGR